MDENYEEIDGSVAEIPGNGLAFTASNHRNLFRINHYITKSEQDLSEKCRRGYPDGNRNADYEESIRRFDVPLTIDKEILKWMN